MKKSVKVIALIMVIVTVVSLFASCGVTNTANKERDGVVGEITNGVLNSQVSYIIANHPRILLMALRLKIKGYDVNLGNGSVEGYKDGEHFYAYVCPSTLSAIRSKVSRAEFGVWIGSNGLYSVGYVGRLGRIVYCGTETGVRAGLSIPEGLWTLVVSKLDFLPRDIITLIS